MDTLIACSYAVIFSCLVWTAAKLRKFSQFSSFLWIFASFAVFILACGGTHTMEILTLWWPNFRLATGVRILCALASVPTAIFFARVTPSLANDIRAFVETLAATQVQRDEAQGALSAAEAIAVERKRAATELAALNLHLHSVMDSTSEKILQVSPEWKILYSNREAVATLPDCRIGADFWSCFPALESALAGQSLRRAMTNGTEERYENYYPPYDKWYRTQVFPTNQGISIFSRDISAERKLQESLLREQSLREQHVEQMSHIAGGLAHEVSNPLAIIHARASDLEEAAASDTPPSPAEVQAVCLGIVKTADRAMRILRGLKTLSREASSDPMESADVLAICQQACELQNSRFNRHHVEMRLAVSPGLPAIFCRETQVGQILANLLNNAFDAITLFDMTERWISLSADLFEQQVRIRVTDTGHGIDAAVRQRIMLPFFTTKAAGQGTGVGLSLSCAIAKDHGGSLTLLDTIGPTCFQLLLPITTRLA